MIDVRLFDNGGETFDRYTAIYTDANTGADIGYRGMSEDPFHPQGFGVWGEGDISGVYERDAELRIEDAPEPVQRCIAQDVASMTPDYDAYAEAVADAIDTVDGADDTMFYVQSFTIANHGEPVAIATWHGDLGRYAWEPVK